jgi:hypothetical protein
VNALASTGLVILVGGMTAAAAAWLIIYFAAHGVQPITPARFESDPAKRLKMNRQLDRMNTRYLSVAKVVLRFVLVLAGAGLVLLVCALAAGGHP